MSRNVLLITGTPRVGKTSVAQKLASRLNAFYVNLTDLALKENLILGKNKKRDSIVIDELRMRRKIREVIQDCASENIIVDGHYAANVVPKELTEHVFVLRRDPVELRRLMERSGFSGRKLWENLASEVLDVCLLEALNTHEKGKVCEIEVSGKNVEIIVEEIMGILNGSKECLVGVVDWLGKLEKDGLLEEYLRI